MGLDLQSKDPRPAGVLDRGILVVIMRILSLVREESGLAKRITLSLSVAQGTESCAEFMAAKEYVLGSRAKIS